jgi:glycosyltransferase involved in cell wall biosynthesis
VATARAQAAAEGLDRSVIFMGERPSAEIPDILEAADVLVSPRSRGTNTPLKIYQYLRSGRAIVATRLLTHTQVLEDSVAILTGASPREFADGILAALADPQMAASIAARAAELAATKYSYDMYLERTREVMARLTSAARAQAAGVVA